MAIYQSMIEAMDQEPRMVEIEATIIDINNSKQRELGVNWRAFKGDDQFLLGNGTQDDLRLNSGQEITPLGEGGILSLVMGDRTKFLARIKALENLGAAKFVSKPHVITNSNVEAILGATTEFFVRLEGKDAVSLEEKSFGTVLRVTPRVFEDGAQDGVNLMISIEDGQAAGGQVDEIPEIARSVVGTQAMIQEGQSLLIGGLMRETTEDNTSKVPVLGDIPALGKLFQSKGQRVTKTELLFLITPRIVGEDQRLSAKGPILQGAIEDIISSSDERSATARDEIKLKTQRHKRLVDGPSVFKKPVDTFKNTVLADGNQAKKPVVKTEVTDLLVVPVLHSQEEVVEPTVMANQSSLRVWQVRNVAEENTKWQVISR